MHSKRSDLQQARNPLTIDGALAGERPYVPCAKYLSDLRRLKIVMACVRHLCSNFTKGMAGARFRQNVKDGKLARFHNLHSPWKDQKEMHMHPYHHTKRLHQGLGAELETERPLVGVVNLGESDSVLVSFIPKASDELMFLNDGDHVINIS